MFWYLHTTEKRCITCITLFCTDTEIIRFKVRLPIKFSFFFFFFFFFWFLSVRNMFNYKAIEVIYVDFSKTPQPANYFNVWSTRMKEFQFTTSKKRASHYENTPIQIYRKFHLQKLKNLYMFSRHSCFINISWVLLLFYFDITDN